MSLSSFNSAHLVVTAAGGLLAFLPLLTSTAGWRLNYGEVHDFSFQTRDAGGLSFAVTYLDSCIIALTLLVPIVLDTLIDMLYATTRSEREAMDATLAIGDKISTWERGLFVLGLVIAPMAGLLPAQTVNLTLVYVCCLRCQFILVIGVIVTSLSRSDPTSWTGVGTAAVLVCHVVAQVTVLYDVNAVAFVGNSGALSTSSFGTTSFVAETIAAALFFAMTCRWLYCTALVRRVAPAVETFANNAVKVDNDVVAQAVHSHVNNKLVYPLLYTLMSLAVFVAAMTYILLRTYDYSWAAKDLVSVNLAVTAIEFLLLVYLLRKNKSDVLYALLAVKEAKKIFVRYISHELGTPLNTAFLGLSILMEDLTDTVAPDAADKERLELVQDVNKAILHAVEVLNGYVTGRLLSLLFWSPPFFTRTSLHFVFFAVSSPLTR